MAYFVVREINKDPRVEETSLDREAVLKSMPLGTSVSRPLSAEEAKTLAEKWTRWPTTGLGL